MKTELPCAIVRDLLPGYVDGLASEETGKAVEAHTAGCEGCRKALAAMSGQEAAPQQDAAAQVDYLKKVRRRSWVKGVCICLGVLLLCAGLAAAWVFGVGEQADSEELMLKTVMVSEDRFGWVISVTGSLTDSGRRVSRVAFEQTEGVVTVRVYAVPLLGKGDGAFQESFRTESAVSQVVIDGGRDADLVMWDGMPISRTAAELYAARNPYVGDMAANNRVAKAAGILRYLGPYTNQLQTTERPYNWTIQLEHPLSSEFFQEQVRVRAIALLAAVENLDTVTISYPFVGETTGSRAINLTVEWANHITGMDVKAQMQTPAGVEELLHELGINWTAWDGMPA